MNTSLQQQTKLEQDIRTSIQAELDNNRQCSLAYSCQPKSNGECKYVTLVTNYFTKKGKKTTEETDFDVNGVILKCPLNYYGISHSREKKRKELAKHSDAPLVLRNNIQ